MITLVPSLQDPRYHHLLASRPLDPGTARRMDELRTRHHHVASCVRDADLKLDAEWDAYQRRKNKQK